MPGKKYGRGTLIVRKQNHRPVPIARLQLRFLKTLKQREIIAARIQAPRPDMKRTDQPPHAVPGQIEAQKIHHQSREIAPIVADRTASCIVRTLQPNRQYTEIAARRCRGLQRTIGSGRGQMIESPGGRCCSLKNCAACPDPTTNSDYSPPPRATQHEFRPGFAPSTSDSPQRSRCAHGRVETSVGGLFLAPRAGCGSRSRPPVGQNQGSQAP